MQLSNAKVVNCVSAILVFLVLLVSIFIIEPVFGAFLHSELHPFDDNFPVAGITTAALATFMIMLFYLRNHQSAIFSNKSKPINNNDLEEHFNIMTDFVSVHDKDFRVIKANKALCEFLNKKPGEIIGQLCYHVFHEDDKPYAHCPHQKTSEIKHPVTEIINDPKIGVPLQITCSPFFDESGLFQGSLHIARVSEAIINARKRRGKMVPICASCKSIRNIKGGWIAPEMYFSQGHHIQFTHSICPDCAGRLYPDFQGNRNS